MKCSVSEIYFCPNECHFDDILIGCQSLDNRETTFLRVREEEVNGTSIFQILPFTTIENCLPLVVELRFPEGPEISIKSKGSVMLYKKYFEREGVTMKVQGTQEDMRVKMNPRQNLEESAKFVAQLSENDMIKMKIGLKFSPGYCSIESEYQIFNNTNLDLIIEGGAELGTYSILSEKSTFLCTRSRNCGIQFKLKMATGSLSEDICLTSCHEDKVITCETTQGCFHFLVSLHRSNEDKQVHISSLWVLNNRTSKNIQIQEQSSDSNRPWFTLKKDSLTQIWTNGKDPSFVMKYLEYEGQTDIFHLDEAKPSATLRINSGSGVSVRLKHYHGKQNTIEVEETSAENVPFTFENCCSELVIKVKQFGEKQCWLVNPGMSHNYTWDNCVRKEQETPFLLSKIIGKHLLSSDTVESQNCSQQLKNSQVLWFWRYAISIVEQTKKNEHPPKHLQLDQRAVTSDGIQQENGVLRHLCASLGWKEEMKKKAIAYNQQRHSKLPECARVLQRCPAGFLGLKPYSWYKAIGCSICTSIGLSNTSYVHHLTLSTSPSMNTVIMVTNCNIVNMLQHHTKHGRTKVKWKVPTSSVYNLPVLEGDNLIIHLDKNSPSIGMNPVIIWSKNKEKLKSLQLAVEYALLLNLPYNPVANVNFKSVLHVDSQ